MNWHQVFAGYMVGFLSRLLYGVRSTDMGPSAPFIVMLCSGSKCAKRLTAGFRNQMRAARADCEHSEVPVDIADAAGGQSKIAGQSAVSFGGHTHSVHAAKIAIEPR